MRIKYEYKTFKISVVFLFCGQEDALEIAVIDELDTVEPSCGEGIGQLDSKLVFLHVRLRSLGTLLLPAVARALVSWTPNSYSCMYGSGPWAPCSSFLIFSSSALFWAACFFSCSARISFLAACLSFSLLSSASSLERSSLHCEMYSRSWSFISDFFWRSSAVAMVMSDWSPRQG